MKDNQELADYLDPLGLGAWQYHPVAASTNDLALEWGLEGAPDWSLVLADTQTKGRGRKGRNWVTTPKSALALSLVLRPTPEEMAHLSHFTALAGLGLIHALAEFGLTGEIKWPNDVLLKGKKVAGILVESDWQGDNLKSFVIGMGVNVTPDAVPKGLRYPATSLEDAANRPINRWDLLGDILHQMMALRLEIATSTFLTAWNEHLAFRNQWVYFRRSGYETQRVKVLGMTPEGHLCLEGVLGEKYSVLEGEIVMPLQSKSQ